MKNVIPSYFYTLNETVDAAQLYLDDARAELRLSGLCCPADAHWTTDSALCSHVGYGETRRANFEIARLKGKPTKKWFHMVIYRAETGRYELTAYIL